MGRLTQWYFAVWLVGAPSLAWTIWGSPQFGSIVLAGFGIFVLIGLSLRSPIIVFILAGVVAGFLMDPPVKGGSMESQTWETVTRLFVGVFLGFLVGLWLNMAVRENRPK